jgi:hypothetical protein
MLNAHSAHWQPEAPQAVRPLAGPAGPVVVDTEATSLQRPGNSEPRPPLAATANLNVSAGMGGQ